MIMQFCMQSVLLFTEVRKHTGASVYQATSSSLEFTRITYFSKAVEMSELAGAKLLTFCRLQCSQEAASKPFSTTKYRSI